MSNKILIVDDELMITNTLATLVKITIKCDTICSNEPSTALQLLSANEIDVIVSDFMMPEMNGLEFLKKAKELKPDVVCILLTGYADKENAISSINEVGIYYYLQKPWDNSALVKILQNALEKKDLSGKLRQKIIQLEKSNNELERMYSILRTDYLQETDNIQGLVISLANLIEAKDTYTEGHTRRVGKISKELGKKLNLSQKDLQNLELSGIIHDIGKVCVSESVLNKPGKLTDEEFELIKEHACAGEKICRSLNCLSSCLDPIKHHHEKLDGSGYPDGLKGDEVSLNARIIGIADIFDALFSERPYRGKLKLDKVEEIMKNDAKNGLIDTDIVTLLFEMIKNKEMDDIIND